MKYLHLFICKSSTEFDLLTQTGLLIRNSLYMLKYIHHIKLHSVDIWVETYFTTVYIV